MADETYYTVLGVPEAATQPEIKAAYRDLIKQVHPDKLSALSPYLRSFAEDKAKDITEAYSLLSDLGKRRQYDRQLAEHRQPFRPPPSSRHTAAQQPSNSSCPKCGTLLFGAGVCARCSRSGQAVNTPSSKQSKSWRIGRTFGSLWHLAIGNPKVTWLVIFCALLVINNWLGFRAYSPSQSRITAATTSAPVDLSSGLVTQPAPATTGKAGISEVPVPDGAASTRIHSESAELAACLKSGVCALADPAMLKGDAATEEAPTTPATRTRPVPRYATVKDNYAALVRRCAFLPFDNFGRCNYQSETIATLKRGDRVRLLSPITRTENGTDVYKVRTEQGWNGWIDSNHILLENGAQ